jgi:hypothetical protein
MRTSQTGKAERNAALIEMYTADPTVTLQQVADRFKISRERVRQIVVEHGIPTRYRPDRPFSDYEYRRFFNAVAVVARCRARDMHGTVSRYGKGCSCELCRQANATRHAELMERLHGHVRRKTWSNGTAGNRKRDPKRQPVPRWVLMEETEAIGGAASRLVRFVETGDLNILTEGMED